MVDHYVVSSITASVTLLMVGRAYIPLLSFNLTDWANQVFYGVLVLALAIFLRSNYWDFSQYILQEDWEIVRDYLGGQQFSTIFNLLVLVACYLLLKGRYLLIPEHEREGWNWWNAWLHPREKCLIFRRRRK